MKNIMTKTYIIFPFSKLHFFLCYTACWDESSDLLSHLLIAKLNPLVIK